MSDCCRLGLMYDGKRHDEDCPSPGLNDEIQEAIDWDQLVDEYFREHLDGQ